MHGGTNQFQNDEVSDSKGAGLSEDKDDSIWGSGTAQSAFIASAALMEHCTLTPLDYQSLSGKDCQEQWAKEILAMAYKHDTSSTQLLNKFCELMVEKLTGGDKAYILHCIAPQEDKLLDLKRCAKFFPVGKIFSIGDLIKAIMNMMVKSKAKEGSFVGQWRSAKRLVLTAKYLCLPSETRTKIYDYLDGVKDAKTIKGEHHGQTENTLKNMHGYIGTTRFRVNCVFMTKWFNIVKVGYEDKSAEGFQGGAQGVTLDEAKEKSSYTKFAAEAALHQKEVLAERKKNEEDDEEEEEDETD